MLWNSLYFGLILVLSVSGASAQFPSFSNNSPKVKVTEGKLRGKIVLTKENKRVRAFLGIPYAKPPVGELRFKSPEPPDSWDVERWAVDPPRPCVQADHRHGEPIGKEDCLYLNVYTPENVEKRILTHINLTATNSTKTNETATVGGTNGNETISNAIPDFTANGAIVDPALADLFTANKITLNGTAVNITALNGTSLNGISLNGTALNGTVLNGTLLNGTVLNGTSLNSTNINETASAPSQRYCLPVMVFFHGGGFETGHTEPFTHEYLLDADIVLVTVQYRLGLLGFFSTGDEAIPGNFGLKDQRMALQWIQKNIETFGGCPEQVTIVGDGAGGASVHYHMLFSQSKNETFRAGISMSGTALSPWAFRPPTEVAHMAHRIAKLSRCPQKSEDLLDCLSYKRADDFVWLLQRYKNETLGGCGEWALSLPILGGVLEDCNVKDAFITANPWDKKVTHPWVVGVTGKEMLYEFTPQLVDRRNKKFKELDKYFDKCLPIALGYEYSNASSEKLPEDIRKFYFKDEPIDRPILADLVDAVSDGSVVYPAFEAVRRAGRRSTWLYHFNYIGSNTYGASALDGRIAPGRGDDLFYFFPRPLGKNFPRKSKEPDSTMSKKMVTLWTNFAIYLDPSPSPVDGVSWTPIAPSTTFLNIGQSVMVVERPFYSYRMNFWSMQEFPHRDDDFGESACVKVEPQEEEPATEAPVILPSDFYPALKWTLKTGWKPLVDTVEELNNNEGESATTDLSVEEPTTTEPTTTTDAFDPNFYPALRWTLKSGWRPLVDTVDVLSESATTDLSVEEPTTTEPTTTTEAFDLNFYPALRWTLKSGWRPLVDTVDVLGPKEG